MQTMGWGDIDHARDGGPFRFHNRTVTIDGDDIAKWMDNPDGRFEIVDPSDDTPAVLGKFYPSL